MYGLLDTVWMKCSKMSIYFNLDIFKGVHHRQINDFPLSTLKNREKPSPCCPRRYVMCFGMSKEAAMTEPLQVLLIAPQDRAP